MELQSLCFLLALHGAHGHMSQIELNGSLEIQSPNYPLSIPAQAQADWSVQSREGSHIRVRFSQFHVPESPFCKDIFVTVTESGEKRDSQAENRFCGNHYENVTTTSNTVQIRLSADGGASDSRFVIQLEEIVSDEYKKPPTTESSNIGQLRTSTLKETTESPSIESSTAAGIYHKYLLEDRWHRQNSGKFPQEPHKKKSASKIYEYEWAFALAAMVFSMLVGVCIIRSYMVKEPPNASRRNTMERKCSQSTESTVTGQSINISL